MDLEKLQEQLEKQYPCGIPRKDLGRATGGLLHPASMANRDCDGIGIPGAFMVGKYVVYPVGGVIDYLQKKIKSR